MMLNRKDDINHKKSLINKIKIALSRHLDIDNLTFKPI
jgi:hypothetical protein